MNDLAGFFAETDRPAIDDDDTQIGRRINEARIALGDPLDDVAQRVGVETATFEAWEAGELSLRANHLNRVAGVLGISLSWLIMGRGTEPMSASSEIGRLRSDLADARTRLDDVINELAVIDSRLQELDDD